MVQDLATQWIQSYPCKTKTSQETQKSLQKFLEPNRKPKVIHLHWQFLGTWQSLWRSLLESLHFDTTQIRNKWDCWESSAQSERRYICSIVAMRSEWKLVGRFHGMCKEYTSISEKMATETLRRKRRQQHEQWDQAWDQLQHEQQVKQQHAQHAHHMSMNAERALLYTCSSCLTPHGSRSESCHFISIVIHERTSLSRFSSSTSTCLSLSSSFPSTSCTASCTLSSTTWSPWKTFATPPTRGVTTPATSPPPSQVMSPTSWPSASSTTLQVPSLTLSRHRTRTWMTWHSASCSQWHTEDKPITANQKACQSVSRRRLLCSIEEGNLREKEMSTNQLVLVSQETRTVLTASFLKTPKLRKWSIDQGNLRSEIAQMHRLGLYLKNRDRWFSQNIARKLVITNSKQLMQKKNAEFYEKNYGVSKRIFVKFINKILQRWRNYENSKVLPSIRLQDESSSRTRTLFWNYQAENKNYKMKYTVWTILRTSRMLNQFAVEIPTLPVDQCLSHLIRYLKDCWGILPYRRAAKKGRQAFGTHMVYRETFFFFFCKSTCIFISSLSSRIESMEYVNWGAASYVYSGEKSERPKQNRDLRCQSGPSARNSFNPSEGKILKELWSKPTTTADFISLHQQRLLGGR